MAETRNALKGPSLDEVLLDYCEIMVLLDEVLLDYCEIMVPFLVYKGMGRKIRHLVEADGLVEITGRCIQRRFLLRPSAKLNAVIRGVLARAQERHGMRVCGFVYLSNHYHLLIRPASVRQMAAFMRDVNYKISKEVGYLHEWEGTVWPRPYGDVQVSDEAEAQIHSLRYLLEQGCKEGLVASPKQWPGASSTKALLSGEQRRRHLDRSYGSIPCLGARRAESGGALHVRAPARAFAHSVLGAPETASVPGQGARPGARDRAKHGRRAGPGQEGNLRAASSRRPGLAAPPDAGAALPRGRTAGAAGSGVVLSALPDRLSTGLGGSPRGKAGGVSRQLLRSGPVHADAKLRLRLPLRALSSIWSLRRR